MQPTIDPISVVVFDCGGVLSEDGLPRHGHESVFPEGLAEQEAKIVIEVASLAWKPLRVGDITTEEYYRRILIAVNKNPELWQEYNTRHLQHFSQWKETGRDVKAREVLGKLKTKGYILGVISNHVSEWFWHIFDECEYKQFFDRRLVVVSEEVKINKPERAIFDEFVSRLQVLHPGLGAHNCVFIDNQLHNVQAAQAAGFRVVHFEAASQSEADLVAKLSLVGVEV